MNADTVVNIAFLLLLVAGAVGAYFLIKKSKLGDIFDHFLGAGDALAGAIESILKWCQKHVGLCVITALFAPLLFVFAVPFLKAFGAKKGNQVAEATGALTDKSATDVVKDAVDKMEEKGVSEKIDNDESLTDAQKEATKKAVIQKEMNKTQEEALKKNDASPEERAKAKEQQKTELENLSESFKEEAKADGKSEEEADKDWDEVDKASDNFLGDM